MKSTLTLLAALLAVAVTGSGGTLVQFRTVFGTVEVELYDADKPDTTGNFKRLVQAGAYRDTFFHRLEPGFVVQGGSYFALNRLSTNWFAPPWSELGVVPHFGPVSNEFFVGPLLSNTNGTIAMAKLPNDPNSATSGWFFNLGDNSGMLDNQNGGFTVFGRVRRDANNVLPFLSARTYSNGLVNMKWWYPLDPLATNAFKALPVAYAGLYHPIYGNLVFVDITLLDVAISRTNGFPQISWTSVAGRTNAVEYTTALPPQWQPLFSLVPGGGRISIIDNTATGLHRFYRVRVDY